jgi:spermidine synthase
MKKYLLEITVFITGMGIMVFELVGSRILAPYVGTTIMVWSALIGVILAALSLGYWWGGKIADQRADYRYFSLIIFFSAVLVALTAVIKLPVINFLEAHMQSFRWEAIWASLILFAPGSFFMAVVSPYAVRLRLASVKESGRTVGRLYSISTIGSIMGTFLTGMVLVPLIGNTKILFSLSGLLLLTSILVFSDRWMKAKVGGLLIVFLGIFFADKIDYHFLPLNFIHSAYLDIAVVPGTDIYSDIDNGNPTGRPILQIFTGPTTIQSAMFSDNDNDLVIPYTKFFRVLSEFFHPGANRSLMIGGAGYSFPKDFIARHPASNIDVVEIDPKMTKVAREFFNLKDGSGITTYNEDGRTFLNRNQNKYDEIFIDSFKTFVAPFQLTTLETAQKVYDSLSERGVVLINMLQSINGDSGKFFRAEYATYKKVFPELYVFRVQAEDPNAVQNIMLVASKNSERQELVSTEPQTNAYLQQAWNGDIAEDVPVITDDFAPVSDYMLAASRIVKN